jgi:hypothetical protein
MDPVKIRPKRLEVDLFLELDERIAHRGQLRRSLVHVKQPQLPFYPHGSPVAK